MSMSFATHAALYQLEGSPYGEEVIEAAGYILGEIDERRPVDLEKVEPLEMDALMELFGVLNTYRFELETARQNTARIILKLAKQYVERELETPPHY